VFGLSAPGILFLRVFKWIECIRMIFCFKPIFRDGLLMFLIEGIIFHLFERENLGHICYLGLLEYELNHLKSRKVLAFALEFDEVLACRIFCLEWVG
jgi:hypothetical protein